MIMLDSRTTDWSNIFDQNMIIIAITILVVLEIVLYVMTIIVWRVRTIDTTDNNMAPVVLLSLFCFIYIYIYNLLIY